MSLLPQRRLDVLLGTWTFVGRTIGATVDDVRGRVRIAWILGGHYQEQRGHVEFRGQKVETLEIVGYDSAKDDFPSTVYGAMGGPPVPYRWQVRGSDVTHAGSGATFRGTLSPDGRTLTGGWRPDPGTPGGPQAAYDVVMTKKEDLIG